MYIYIAQAGAQPPMWTVAPYFIFIFAIFYFLIIRPQKKREKDHKTLVSSLSKNDDVVTTGGIHGTVSQVKETTVVLRLGDNVKVEFEKSSVTAKKKAKNNES